MADATPLPGPAARAVIGDLLSRAAFALDEQEDAMLSACFAENAVFSLRIAGGDLIGPFEGREGIMGLMRGAWDEQTDKRRHVVSNVFYPPAGEATVDGAIPVVSYLSLFATEHGEAQLLCTGIYRDEVIVDGSRCELVRRHLDLEKAY
ncbi:nuclear transport factor 2 family protein [Pseudohaliea sp.]|uniref:nuclear transport factor 2 family protein n=1 Tax=Pseudohaliea sp. TaxID=2740289 RepID=UPI0032EBB07C